MSLGTCHCEEAFLGLLLRCPHLGYFQVESCQVESADGEVRCTRSPDGTFRTLHLGDINGDGRVTVEDLQLCVNVVRGQETRPPIVERCHVLGRDEVTRQDADYLAQEILRR